MSGMYKFRLQDGKKKSRGTYLGESVRDALAHFEGLRCSKLPKGYRVIGIGPATAADVIKEAFRGSQEPPKPKLGAKVFSLELRDVIGQDGIATKAQFFGEVSIPRKAQIILVLDSLVQDLKNRYSRSREF